MYVYYLAPPEDPSPPAGPSLSPAPPTVESPSPAEMVATRPSRDPVKKLAAEERQLSPYKVLPDIESSDKPNVSSCTLRTYYMCVLALSITGHRWILLNIIGCYWILPDITGYYRFNTKCKACGKILLVRLSLQNRKLISPSWSIFQPYFCSCPTEPYFIVELLVPAASNIHSCEKLRLFFKWICGLFTDVTRKRLWSDALLGTTNGPFEVQTHSQLFLSCAS